MLEIEVRSNNVFDCAIEVWCDVADVLSLAVQPPGGTLTEWVTPPDDYFDSTAAGNEVNIIADTNASDTGDVRTTILLARGTASFIQPGTWKLHLRAESIVQGRFDAWIERSCLATSNEEQARFADVSAEPSRTISIPGTARHVITVGSYVTRPGIGSPPVGAISDFSSRGPTRYGLLKPEISAPGEMIVAPRSASSRAPGNPDAWHMTMSGTSMAAPHITGIAAIIFSGFPRLTGVEVKQILMRATRQTNAAALAPDNTWGLSKIDFTAAIGLAGNAVFPTITGVAVQNTIISWTTDVPTTAELRYHTHRRQLQLGKFAGSRAILKLATSHQIDLADLPPRPLL